VTVDRWESSRAAVGNQSKGTTGIGEGRVRKKCGRGLARLDAVLQIPDQGPLSLEGKEKNRGHVSRQIARARGSVGATR